MLFSLSSKDHKISVFEAHSIWNLLSAKYHGIDNVQLWYNYAHDMDLKKILKDFLKDLDEHVTLLEKELEKYSIEAPPRPKKHARGDVYTQILSDEIIGINYFTFLQGMVDMVLFSIQYSFYNDQVSTFFQKFYKHAIEQTNTIVKYLKFKGWIDIPPVFLNAPKDTGEQLGSIEAFHLWSHTNYRYINIEETMKWKEFVHDIDFRNVLEKGLKTMNRQVATLEEELEKFGLPIPKRPPNVVKGHHDKSIFQDEYIFRTLFIGLQWAGVLHAKAFQQCVTNDRIRNLFKNFLYDEIGILTHLIKYGKLKGWLNIPPEYITR